MLAESEAQVDQWLPPPLPFGRRDKAVDSAAVDTFITTLRHATPRDQLRYARQLAAALQDDPQRLPTLLQRSAHSAATLAEMLRQLRLLLLDEC